MSEPSAPFDVTPGAQVPDGARNYLRQTRPWVRLTSMVTLVIAVVMILAALAFFAIGLMSSGSADNRVAGIGGMVGGVVAAGIYTVLALLYIAPAFFLWWYASAIGRLLKDGSWASLEEALKHQRSFWVYVGIMMLIGLVLMLAGVAAAIVIPLMLRTSSV